MTRLVIDTNVFVSAALKRSSFPAIVVRWAYQNAVLLKSAGTEFELMTVLTRSRFAGKIWPGYLDMLQSIFRAAENVEIVEFVAACRDPNDDKFLELALNGQADILVSGDDDLLVMRNFRGTQIVNPANFVVTSAFLNNPIDL